MTDRRLPTLANVSAQLAANHAKVVGCIDAITVRVDELATAVAGEDWPKVQQLSGQLVEQGRGMGYRAVSAMAHRVCEEASRPNNAIGIKRSMVRLIGVCGQIDR